MTTNVVSALAQKNRAFLNRAKPQRIGSGGVAGLSFDGVNDYVQTTLNYQVGLYTPVSFSFFLMVKSFLSNNDILLSNRLSGLQGVNVTIRNYSGNRRFDITMLNNGALLATGVTADVNIQTDVLYHVVFTKGGSFEASNYKAYVNGADVTTPFVDNITAGSIVTPQDTFDICAFNKTLFFANVNIQDFKAFNKVLTQYEVKELFYKRGDVPQNFARGSMIADYRFNNFQRLSAGIADDSSPNRNNGTLINYTAGDLTAGVNCKILDRFGNPIRA